MKSSLLLKFIVVGILILAILIPLGMIRDTIAERQAYRQQAVAKVAESYAGPQTLVGPVLVVPYLAEVQASVNDTNGLPHTVAHNEWSQWVFFPRKLRLNGVVVPGVRHLGLHEVRVYQLRGKLEGDFELGIPQQAGGNKLVQIGTPFLSFGVDDVRGLIGTPVLQVDGKSTSLLQGAGTDRVNAGVHAEIGPLGIGERRVLGFAFDFVLGGTERLAITPIADDNRIELSSTWPSPQFSGSFLPLSPDISAAGFHAVWDVSALATNAQNQLTGATTAKVGNADRIELTLVDPVNIYSQADRASKYGLLFVLLTFVGFFMFELIKQLRIHPIQYLLVGLALAIFFLLLISLSEHIPFLWAYLAASGACIGLLGFYLSHVLRSRVRGIGFAAMLAALYAVLYGLLISEDNALVLSSMMLFAILAAIMVITRRIDWYGVARQPDAVAATLT